MLILNRAEGGQSRTMYNHFFGLRERPFQLVPNPAYLYLSRSHEEALAHLTYAIAQGDGFVEITGEVGTGKTTLCRAFVEGLDENTEVAYIFNPKLNSIQLLKAINDEFGIPSDGDNTKDLIDILNTFLMKKRSEGKKVILLIDEAQNLSTEVLEQLRLLSNLETSTSKLLQIILVGQPELGEMLDSHDLRQLGQRITLSCHINPLTVRETREYIQHRINIASKKPGDIFTKDALRTIHRYSGGIPRLINIACDRALLTAFGLDRQKINSAVAKAAIREIAGRGEMKRLSFMPGNRMPLLLGALCVVLLAVVIYSPGNLRIGDFFSVTPPKNPVVASVKPQEADSSVLPPSEQTPPKEESEPPPTQEAPKLEKSADVQEDPVEQESIPILSPAEEQAPIIEMADLEPPAVDKEIAKAPVVVSVQNLGEILGELSTRSTRRHALKAAMDQWRKGALIHDYLDRMDDDQSYFRLAAKQNGLLVKRIDKDFDLLRKLNIPAILEFYLPEGLAPRYLTLTKMEGDDMNFMGGGDVGVISVGVNETKSYWSGVAFVLWKNFLDYNGTIPHNAPRDSIVTLKMLMTDIGYTDIEISPFYDERTKEAVKEIQKKHGIVVDGVVGPLTKIVLYNENADLGIPHITGEY